MSKFLKNLGPGVLVSSAFIGPGTVTVCSLAGVEFGYGLLWALLLSVMACIVLQEMSARLGLVTQKGLSENIREALKTGLSRILVLGLIFSAIVIGNAAYEAGNISGAVLGIEAVLPSLQLTLGNFSLHLWPLVIGLFAFLLLYMGSYKALEKVFIGLVLLMSISFLITAIISQPDFLGILRGFVPGHLSDGILSVIALVGTTVVPYNLFLHASLVNEKWQDASSLKMARNELKLAILVGGAVSMAIVVCGAASGLTHIENASDLAVGLEPLFGKFATWSMAIGLLAAGITSAITAPLAAAYVVKGCLGWKQGLSSGRFKLVWGGVLLLGVILSSLGLKPIQIIRFA